MGPTTRQAVTDLSQDSSPEAETREQEEQEEDAEEEESDDEEEQIRGNARSGHSGQATRGQGSDGTASRFFPRPGTSISANGASTSAATEHVQGVDALRAARLSRFGAPVAAIMVPVSTLTTASTTNRLEPSRSVILVASRSASVEVVARQRPALDLDVPALDENRAAPTGQHRLDNLKCPQCRDAVIQAPIKVFILSDLVELLRARDGTAAASRAGYAPSRGMAENDNSWAGLFTVLGVETKEQKRARTATVVRDGDDNVRRCGECAWELDQYGMCEGCGREFALSSEGEGENIGVDGDSPRSNPFAEEARSEDDEGDALSDPELFLDDRKAYRHRRRGEEQPASDSSDSHPTSPHHAGAFERSSSIDEVQVTAQDQRRRKMNAKRRSPVFDSDGGEIEQGDSLVLSSSTDEELDDEASYRAPQVYGVHGGRKRRVIVSDEEDEEEETSDKTRAAVLTISSSSSSTSESEIEMTNEGAGSTDEASAVEERESDDDDARSDSD